MIKLKIFRTFDLVMLVGVDIEILDEIVITTSTLRVSLLR